VETASLDRSIQILNAHKEQWARLPVRAKWQRLQGIIRRQVEVAERQVSAAARAKSIPPGPLEAEEWAGGPYLVVRYSRLLMKSLQDIAAYGTPLVEDSAIRTRPDGQLVVRVFPTGIADRLLFAGFRGEVWMARGVTRENLAENMACFYRQKEPAPKMALVLGAGNVAGIGPLDVLTKLYLDGSVCLLKLNPVNQYLGPFVEEVFGELIQDGYVRVAYGGADVGQYLCDHPGIDEIHITGSDATHDAIVFGAGEEGRERKRKGMPRLRKRITSELGNVSPIIVVPGPWTASQLKFQAENIATQMVNNAGFNCAAARVLVLPEGWPIAGALMDELRRTLATAPQRRAYYPGAEERYERFVSANKTAQAIGSRQDGVLPWTIIRDLSPNDATNICYTTECFCAVIAQTALPASGPGDFLRHAVDFCNEKLWGTLNACILVHPETEKELGAGLEDMIASLRYGTVGVNHWPVLGFGWGITTWGAFPGHTHENIQSGTGVVHNSLLFDRPERSVIYGPFHVVPKPAWFVTNRNAHKILPRLTRMQASPNLAKFVGVMSAAVTGL